MCLGMLCVIKLEKNKKMLSFMKFKFFQIQLHCTVFSALGENFACNKNNCLVIISKYLAIISQFCYFGVENVQFFLFFLFEFILAWHKMLKIEEFIKSSLCFVFVYVLINIHLMWMASHVLCVRSVRGVEVLYCRARIGCLSSTALFLESLP